MTRQTRYWDLTEEEKQMLAREDLDAFFAQERMEKGVLLPQPIVLQSEEVPKPPVTIKYRPSGPGRYGSSDSYPFAFDTMAEAEAFLKLNPCGLIQDWQGSQIPYTAGGNRDGKAVISIAPVEVTSEEEHNRISVRALAAEKATKANREARDAYDKGIKESDQAIESILEDFETVQRRKRRVEQIRATFAEYLKLSGGNEVTAIAFLLKAYKDASEVHLALQGIVNQDLFQIAPPRAEELASGL
jgi:hypothetical protein